MAPTLTLYGTDLSQPCRAVSWLLRYHNVPFEYVQIMPGSKKEGGSRTESFLKELNPSGNVPVIKHGDVVVDESAAILVYLAEVFHWNDVWSNDPKDAPLRARINRWLHWHHRNSREVSLAYFAPVVRRDLKFPADLLDNFKRNAQTSLKQLETQLKQHAFLAETKTPTLADFAVYADLGQLELLNMHDLAAFPSVKAWTERMRKLKEHDSSHEGLMALKPLLAKAKM